MLRPLLAFACLALTAFLLAPTVQSVHEQVEDLHFKRDLPKLWKWNKRDDPPPLLPLICDDRTEPTYSEVDKWPARIRKNETFTLGGFVNAGVDGKGRGIHGVTVDLFLNETKELPGEHLGQASTGPDGRFTLTTSIPFELKATKYHLVAHALQKRDGCTVYLEHWSDPEMEVTSTTQILLFPVEDAVAGYPFHARGRLVDQVGAPVRNAEVTVTIGGVARTVRTGGDGIFAVEHTAKSAGTLPYTASFRGTDYYGASSASAEIAVVKEQLRLDVDALDLVRSEPQELTGRVVLPPGTKPQPVHVRFDGVKLVTCEGCPPASGANVTPAADGTFRVRLLAPSDQDPGGFKVTFSGGGLSKDTTLAGRLLVPVRIVLDAEGQGPVTKALDGRVRLVDEAGRPWHGAVAAHVGDAWASGSVDKAGEWTFALSSPCGTQRVRALYNGTAEARPAVAEEEVPVCPLLAALPPWLAGMPLWALAAFPLLLALLILVAWRLARRWFLAVAPTISHGPPLTLTHTRPQDAAVGIVGAGEPATLTAFLEEPLPDGHTLRMGLARSTRPVAIQPDLRAEWTVTPDGLGEVTVRAEILDPRGRVVTRRTATVRVVRYAEEIESRYKAMRNAAGAGDAVSPRQFEAWLRERSPGLDPEVAARLVAIFEEADYGPRDAGRQELVAFMEAQGALPEVSARVVA